MAGADGSHRTAQMATSAKIVKFVRLLRLMRTLRLAKLAMVWEGVEARMGSLILRQSVALLRVIVVLAGICHWNACIWWMIGQPSSLLTEFMSTEAQRDFRGLRHWTTVTRGAPGEEWSWENRTRTEQYTFCFYWTLGVMRTMPAEVSPENQPERVYVMVFMFFAFSAFAICVALITQTFFRFAERKRAFDDDMAQVRLYLRGIKQGGASDRLQSAIKAHLAHLYKHRKTHVKEQTMLSNLPASLASQLKYERVQVPLSKLDILWDLPPKAAVHVSEISEIRDVPPAGRLCKRGNLAEACWILISGQLHVTEGPGQSGDLPLDIVDQDCLREQRPIASTRTVTAVVPSEMVRIDKAKFMKTMAKHRDFKYALGLFDEVADGFELLWTSDTLQRQESDAVATTAVLMS